MNTTKELISTMNPKERRGFVQYLNARNKRNDVRNVKLFRSYIDGTEVSVKNEIGSNAFNVLKKRLNDGLLDYLGKSVLENQVTEEGEIIKRIVLARKLFAFNHHKLAYKLLRKVEKEASLINHYSLLNEIYHTMIENAHRSDEVNHVELYERLERNTELFLREERLNLVYASIQKAYAYSERTGEKLDLEKLLKENLLKYDISEQSSLSLKALFKLVTIADVQGFHYRNYHDVDIFFVKQIENVQGSPEDVEKNIVYHIGLLYTVSNILFRKMEFEQSLHYLEMTREQMERFDGKYKNVYYNRYVVLVALNLNYLGRHEEAANMLDELLATRKKKEFNLAQAKLTRVLVHFQQNEFDQVRSIISELHHTDSWYENHIGMEWTLNKNFIEILLHIELGNTDLVDSRIASFKRRYQSFFKETNSTQVLTFLQLIKQYHLDPHKVSEDTFKKKVYGSLEFKPGRETDIFLLSYYAWLKAKMDGRRIYETTLELLHKV